MSVRRLPELRVGGDAVVDRAVALVGLAALHQGADHQQHLGNLAGGADVELRRRDVDRRHVAQVDIGLLAPQHIPGDADLAGAAQHVVVDVGHVLHVAHVVVLVGQVARQRIECDVSKGMADVRRVVWRHATDIHTHGIVADRELLDARAAVL